ncbi:MAG: LAGLIDADG family homing endonuclease [Candidatus Woesearchaeota archaeon]
MTNKITFPKEITSDIAYLSGVFAGDGSLNYREKKHEYSLKCVGNPKDEKDFYHKVVSIKFEKSFGLKPLVRHFDSNTTFGFTIYSKELFYYFTKTIGLPFGIKYDNLKIPEIFLKDKILIISFIRGVFDTEGCITFKKRYRTYPYYPVISISSKSKVFIKQIVKALKEIGLKPVEIYDYNVKDPRTNKGPTIINRIELNGKTKLEQWLNKIGSFNPKHLNKIKRWKGK